MYPKKKNYFEGKTSLCLLGKGFLTKVPKPEDESRRAHPLGNFQNNFSKKHSNLTFCRQDSQKRIPVISNVKDEESEKSIKSSEVKFHRNNKVFFEA